MLRRRGKGKNGDLTDSGDSGRKTDSAFRYGPPWEQTAVEWKAPRDNQYRPSSLDQFIGQERNVQRLRIAITSA